MNPIGAPPTRRPFTEEEGRPVSWLLWFDTLAKLFNTLQGAGTTAQRPVQAPFVGFMYFDTTLNRPIWAKTITTSTAWVFSDGTAA